MAKTQFLSAYTPIKGLGLRCKDKGRREEKGEEGREGGPEGEGEEARGGGGGILQTVV